MYEPEGGVTVFHDPPVKCSITGHGAVEHVAVVEAPPPTAQTSPLLSMYTEFRPLDVPMATPLVHMNPFQWMMVGSVVPSVPVPASPTAHPSFGLTALIGGPKDIDFKVLSVGLVTVPQFAPSQCRMTSAVPTLQPLAASRRKTEWKSNDIVGDVGTRLTGSFVHVPPE